MSVSSFDITVTPIRAPRKPLVRVRSVLKSESAVSQQVRAPDLLQTTTEYVAGIASLVKSLAMLTSWAPRHLLVVAMAGDVNREQLGGKRIRFTDEQRQRSAIKSDEVSRHA